MKKKRRLKKKVIIILISLLILMLITIFFLSFNIRLIGEKKMVLNYGEKYSEPGYKFVFLGKNHTDDVKVSSNLGNDEGKYFLIYRYKIFFQIRFIVVKDVSSPKIELKDDEIYHVTIGTEWVEPGYSAIDNKDGDVTNLVDVQNNINMDELGSYEVVYKVTDKSGNESIKKRNVIVDKINPMQMSLTEYTLDGWYEETKLKETVDYGSEYFDKFKIIGDSNVMNMYLNGILNGVNAWAIPCLHAESMHNTELNLYGLGIKMKVLDAIEKYRPKDIILNFGTFSSAWISEENFINNANALLDKIKKISPETNVTLISIYPIIPEDINHFSQEEINKRNFLILKMANEHGLKYLDVQEVLKDDSGYGKREYYAEDNYHLTYKGHMVVKKYIQTHALEH